MQLEQGANQLIKKPKYEGLMMREKYRQIRPYLAE
jgi:hypothetical protein